MNVKNVLLVGPVLLALAGVPAYADVIVEWDTSGTTSGGSVAGKAVFDIGASNMTVTVTNSTSAPDMIAQVLDGLTFSLTGGSGLALTNVAASGGFEDCTGASCVPVGSFVDYHAKGDPTLTSPYDWTLIGSLLSAGGGSYKPAGIVNSGVTSADGIPNAQHNDYLVGPVTFTFSFTTAPTDVTGADFAWGTTPELTTGTCNSANSNAECGTSQAPPPPPAVPEPSSVLLLGTAGLGIAMAMKRRFGSTK